MKEQGPLNEPFFILREMSETVDEWLIGIARHRK
jgi:hypothetical protein